MMLEDFFTLTEMKNGLATSARVEELISMMQKQVDIVTSNTGDAERHLFYCCRHLSCDR